jgi:serine phosphatase RsbU (regulator of sigma subunit)
MLLSLITIVIGGVIALLLYPGVHPSAGMAVERDAAGTEKQVANMLRVFRLDRAAYDITTRLTTNNAVVHGTLTRFRAAEAYSLLRERGNGYSWTAQIREKDPSSVTVRIGKGPDENQLRRMLTGDLQLAFDMHGKLQRVFLPVEDSARLASRSPAASYSAVRAFLLTRAVPRLLGPLVSLETFPDSLPPSTVISGISYSSTRQAHRIDHRFSWTVYDDVLQDSIDVHAVYNGDVVGEFGHQYRSIGEFTPKADMTVVDLIEIGVFSALIIILLVVGFRRMRSDEIGFGSALVVGAGVAILFAIWLYLQVFSSMGFDLEAAVALLIAPIMIGGGIAVLWAVSEAVGRETWREKFISFDLTTRGHLLHSRIGLSVLAGIAAGTILLVVALLAAWAVSASRTVWIPQLSSDGLSWLSTSLPALFLAGEALFSNLAGFAFLILFLLSLLQQRLRRTGMVLSAGTIVLVAIDLPNMIPVPEAILVQLPVVFLLLLLFFYTDVLTTLLAMVTLSLLQNGLLLLLPWNAALLDQGILLLALLGGAVMYGVITTSTPDRQLDFDAIAPRFQRHISERQRLARELEIARDVQMSFLPKRTPHVEGLDIAAHCAPALEVGGDYYDFIELGPTKIGLAIGDVSGKGTQAAFYMTLTKGFLKALGGQSESPSLVLGQLNKLFYENVERGHFISMIYAVFDMERRTVTIARAGHTPVIRRNADASVETIHSRGMALGFEAGRTFTATIEEIVLPLRTGDMLVFYTDGYPEAMTRKREEFGEQRLTTSLQNVSGETAEDAFNHIHRETLRFTGTAKQHDDMSMVVVRVT